MKFKIIIQDKNKLRYKDQISELELKIAKKKEKKDKSLEFGPTFQTYEFMKPLPVTED